MFEYDKGDNLISETHFDGHQSRYRFDALGNLTEQIDNPHLPSNQQRRISYERDLIGQVLTQHSRSAEQSYQVDYQYDKAGKLLSAINPHSRTDFAYDANGQLIKEQQTSTLNIAGLQHEYSLTLQHQYDELGNRIVTTLPDGKVINQLYYGSGHLYNQSLYDPSTDQHIELRHSERNKLHVEVNRQQGFLDSAYTHDPMGRLINQNSSYSDQIVVGRQYQYDPIGQLTDINSQTSLIGKDHTVQQHTRNHHYQYDTTGRLTQHKLAGSKTSIIEQFTFDPAGNRVSTHNHRVEDTNKQTQTAIPKHQGRPTELITLGKRVRYSYDSNGRVINKTIASNAHQSDNNLVQFKKELTFKYNANNELSQTILTHHKGSDTIVTTTDYYYDAFGRRIHKHSQIAQGFNSHDKHTHMLWDGDKAIQEHTDTHVYNTIYDQGSFTPVARMVWLKDNLQQAANNESDNTISEQDSRAIQVYHYYNDQLGTPNELTNEQGEVVWLADYEAWGNTAKVVWHEQAIDQIQVSAEELQPIRFQGQHFDEETGLHYNRFRYYDPDMGMFTTRDPIGLMGGLNVFAYAPNPTGWVDPLGLNNSPTVKVSEAQSCYRNLKGVPFSSGTNFGPDEYFNTAVAHQHIFYDDGTSVGYGAAEGIYRTGEDKSEYFDCDPIYKTKEEIEQAISAIRSRFQKDDYKLFGNNCQSFIDEIIAY